MISNTSSSACSRPLYAFGGRVFLWSSGAPADEGEFVGDIENADPSSLVHLCAYVWANFPSVNTLVPAVNIKCDASQVM